MYRTYKNTFETEMYVNKPMAFKFRKWFSMLRCGTAPLRIETDRYERLPVEQRVCEVGDSDNVEDEMHLLISRMLLFKRDQNCLPMYHSLLAILMSCL